MKTNSPHPSSGEIPLVSVTIEETVQARGGVYTRERETLQRVNTDGFILMGETVLQKLASLRTLVATTMPTQTELLELIAQINKSPLLLPIYEVQEEEDLT